MLKFINTTVITYVATIFIYTSASNESYKFFRSAYGAGGLVENVTYNFITNSFVPAVMGLNVSEIISLGKLKVYLTKRDTWTHTQKDLNDIFERPTFDLQIYYSNFV